MILGRGGSARAAAVALGDNSEIEYVTRDSWDERGARSRAADLLINCTPLGRGGEAVIRPADLPRLAVIDLVYVPGGTPLVAAAKAAGLPVADGWAVLVAQGAASFTGWTSLPAPYAAMWAAVAR